jgi:hypothetical protein
MASADCVRLRPSLPDQRDQESEHAISRPSAAPASSAPFDETSQSLDETSQSLDETSHRAIEGSTVIRLQGHLFDTGLINAALDVVEAAGGRFDLLEVSVRPNATHATGAAAGARFDSLDSATWRHQSSALMQLTLDEGR